MFLLYRRSADMRADAKLANAVTSGFRTPAPACRNLLTPRGCHGCAQRSRRDALQEGGVSAPPIARAQERASARAGSPARSRRFFASTNHQSLLTNHAVLPGTVTRVEMHLSRTKQTVAYASTRNVPAHGFCEFCSRECPLSRGEREDKAPAGRQRYKRKADPSSATRRPLSG